MTSLRFYLLNNAFHLRPHIGGSAAGWGKQILKALLYLLSLARARIGMGGSCGSCGDVFIVYALYLSLINAVLMSAVIDISEQRLSLTQRADGFLPTFKVSEGSKTLPLACVFALEQEDRCSRKIYTKPKTVNLCFPPLLEAMSSLEALFWFSACPLKQKARLKDVFFSVTMVNTRFPQMKACDSDAEQSRGSVEGLSGLLLLGNSIQPISAVGSLFSNDLLTDK